MKIAVIGDIHSNLYALESVLEDIQKQPADWILATGDLVGYSPFPNETIDLLRSHNILSIQGNYDKAVGNREMLCGCGFTDPKLLELAALSMQFTNQTIRDDNRAYLRTLPSQLNLKMGGLEAVVVHGSPRVINEALYAGSVELNEVTQAMAPGILIYGHTHLAYYQIVNGIHVVNTGSVGKPKGTVDATYAVIEICGGDVAVEIREVPYDLAAAVRAIEENPILPNAFAKMLKNG